MVNKCLKSLVMLLLGTTLLFSMIGCGKTYAPVKLADSIDQIQGLEEYAPTGTLAKSFSDKVIYQVNDISWDGNDGIANVKITTPDLAEIISKSIEKAIDICGTEDYETLLNQAKDFTHNTLVSDYCPMTVSVVEMEAKKAVNGYILISNKEFEKIISGNLEEIFMRVLLEGLANENAN